MDPVEALGSGAQIATALAGFTGVVVVFGSGAVHQWPAIDRFRLQLMLTSSVLPLVLCLLGMLVLSAAPSSDGTWRWCSGLTAAFFLLGGLFNTRTFLAFPTGAFEAVGGSRLTFIAVAADLQAPDESAFLTPARLAQAHSELVAVKGHLPDKQAGP